MRVLHVLDHSVPHHSGYAFRTLALLRGQRALGWDTFHLTGPKQGASALVETVDGLEFFRTPATPSGTSAVHQWRLMRALRRRLAEVVACVKPDVLHVHSPVLNGLPALAVARQFGLPVVYEVRAFWEDAAVDHGSTREGSLRYRLSRALETHVMQRADHVTTICEGLAREIRGRALVASKVTVIPNGVEVEAFAPRAADENLKRELGLAGKTVLGFIGSFYAYEGLDVLLEALALLPGRGLGALLVGGGPQAARLTALANERGLREVVFAGRVPQATVARYYDLVDVLVYPRRSMRLTELVTPMKPLEAMAGGRLVLASDVGGHRELIAHQKTGWLFAPDSPAALARAIEEMLAARAAWPALGRAAREFVQAERTWAMSTARYSTIFEALVNTGRRARG